jgi:hypothetical protein
LDQSIESEFLERLGIEAVVRFISPCPQLHPGPGLMPAVKPMNNSYAPSSSSSFLEG